MLQKFNDEPDELINELDVHGPKYFTRLMFSKRDVDEWSYIAYGHLTDE